MSKTALIKEEKLSAVSWVDNRWFILVILTFLSINAAAFAGSALPGKDFISFILVSLHLLGVGLLSYPYLHYREEGGFVKRIPPRFHSQKPFYSKTNL
jgi:hypothetical protein